MRPVSVSSGGVLLQNRTHRLHGSIAIERALAGKHFVKNRAETEEIGAVVGALSLHLLGRHVADRSHYHARLSLRGQGRGIVQDCTFGVGEFGQAEVENLNASVAGDENVLRL